MKKNNFKSIKEKLGSLPKINDDTSKDDLFLRVSSRMIEEGRPKSKKQRPLIPIFGTVFVIAIFLLMFPSLMDRHLHHSRDDVERSTAEDMDVKIDHAQEKNIASFEESTDLADDSTLNNDQYVIQSLDDKSTIIHTAVVDKQLQYVIPLSLVVPKTNDLNFYYNHLNEFLIESEWGVSEYMFKNIIFDIDETKEEVVMEFPEDYSIGEGEAHAHVFEKSLSVMFRPYGFEKIVFKSPNDAGIDLGSIGVLHDMALVAMEPSNYKLYQLTEEKRSFLIPIPQEGNNISEALENMKQSEELFHVYGTIPSDVHFTVDVEEDGLIITFGNDTEITYDEKVQTMIEAILMTAKSYGYNDVLFENVPLEHIGPYKMSEPIDVPEAVNPMTQITNHRRD